MVAHLTIEKHGARFLLLFLFFLFALVVFFFYLTLSPPLPIFSVGACVNIGRMHKAPTLRLTVALNPAANKQQKSSLHCKGRDSNRFRQIPSLGLSGFECQAIHNQLFIRALPLNPKHAVPRVQLPCPKFC